MQRTFVIDASTLIACERGGLLPLIGKLKLDLRIPSVVLDEIGNKRFKLNNSTGEVLKGKTLYYARQLEKYVGKGDAACIALAKHLPLHTIISDDRKLLRQVFFSKDRYLQDLGILGFSFLLHRLYKEGLVKDVWSFFERIVAACNWKRSEVEIANYTFLKEMGY